MLEAHEQLLRALGGVAPVIALGSAKRDAYAERILVSVGARSIVVPLEDVTHFEADGYHVLVHAGTARYILRESLRDPGAARRSSRIHPRAPFRIVPDFSGAEYRAGGP